MGGDAGKGAVYAALKQGRVIVEHPPDGPYPLVIPGKGVKLKLNGQECNGPVPVTSSDEVIVETLKEEIPGSWQVEITPDLMKAVLRIKPREVIEYILRDLPPARQLHLEATEKREQFLPFTLQELLHELSRLKIIRGIDWEAINRILLSPEEGEVVLAQGSPPQPGKDGWVEFLFNPSEKVKVELPEEGNVDLRQRFIFTSVQPGAVLARKHPAQPGKPGDDIMGNVVPPPPPQDVLLEAGEGTILLKDGQEVVANRPGRPVAIRGKEKVRVKIVNTLNHMGDVDSSSGHISFAGDIFISGSVLEGMRVEAGENVAIAGMVSEAIIKAQKSVSLGGNVYSSTIIAGESIAFARRVLPLLKRLYSQLSELSIAISQLRHKYTGNVGPVVKLLLERRFAGLPAGVQVLKTTLSNLPLGQKDIANFVTTLEQKLVWYPLAIATEEEIHTLVDQAKELVENLDAELVQGEGDVTVGYSLNSKIIAAGNVTVTRIGCDNCTIEAGKKVVIHGAFRGGEISAGEDVYVEELGSRGGARTLVATSEGRVVTIGYAYENSFVRIGNKTYSFTSEQREIRLRLSREGYFDIIPISGTKKLFSK